jgi:hypothetical protein
MRSPDRAIQAARSESVRNYPQELSFRPTNVKLLRWVAQATGGQYAPAPADLFATAEDAVPWTEALGPFLLTAALLIFLIDFAFLRVLRQRVLIGQTMGRQIPRDGDGKYKSERPIAARPLVSKCRRQDLNLHSLNEN